MKEDRFDPAKVIHLGTTHLPDDIARMASNKIEEAEQDIQEMRMQIRWNKQQISVIKKAAALIGIPYQTYAKQTLFQQALKDIKDAETYGNI